eukprot:CAMPEP_0203791448 /NCGR_PEP_ID=MMETSP0100_2-20121128/4641_1 /ASSEMBLY_ACC=CAM_ASM_000210 /TAXON_ID=96639 /ORGANISM=" , Strain NY0313808BC1" /LENGTH=159 /DNA_ID=CAMNT_0050694769 /DNA_START=41 /DNA_END=517 /DNA_ORIENTATION=+
MHKLIHGESCRVISVLDESIYQFQLVSRIPESLNIDSIVGQLDAVRSDDLLACLRQLSWTERRFTKALRANSKDQLQLYTTSLHEATRHLCRCLKNDPVGAQVLADLSNENGMTQKFFESKDQRGEVEVEEQKESKIQDPSHATDSFMNLLETLENFKE